MPAREVSGTDLGSYHQLLSSRARSGDNCIGNTLLSVVRWSSVRKYRRHEGHIPWKCSYK